MDIRTIRTFAQAWVGLALDMCTGQHLLGQPFDHGGAGHTAYWMLTKAQFAYGLGAPEALHDRARVPTGGLYYSTLAGG